MKQRNTYRVDKTQLHKYDMSLVFNSRVRKKTSTVPSHAKRCSPIRKRRMLRRERDYFFPPDNSPGLLLACYIRKVGSLLLGGERKLLTLFTVSQIYSWLVFIRTVNRLCDPR